MADAPYDEIVAAVAERLGTTAEEVERVMDTYAEEAKKRAERHREALKENPTYQKFLERKRQRDKA